MIINILYINIYNVSLQMFSIIIDQSNLYDISDKNKEIYSKSFNKKTFLSDLELKIIFRFLLKINLLTIRVKVIRHRVYFTEALIKIISLTEYKKLFWTKFHQLYLSIYLFSFLLSFIYL